ncbi:MAG: SGNH/GDSL hydrolase family protein, partial [Cytophagales bacterium]|nr:SGNH/GDSL hydrolase family protein [Rhizobacter sp.]
PPPPPPPPPLPPSPLDRVRAALQRSPISVSSQPISVTHGEGNSFTSSLGPGVVVYPPIGNPEQATLATIPQIYGHRRELWRWPTDILLNGRALYAITSGACGLHFRFDGAAFEIYFGGKAVAVTLVADGQYMSSGLIRTTLDHGVPGVPLSTANNFVRFDFGTRAVREISAYIWSDLGPCAIAVAAGDTLMPWDRSGEASFVVVADSYGGGAGPNWLNSPFWETAAQLGIPHLYSDAIGGTGYAINATYQLTGNPALAYTADPAYAFPGRLAKAIAAAPDLVLTSGGINDNNGILAAPYASTGEAAAGFAAAVRLYYRNLRTALPEAVLAATGPWAPRQNTPTNSFAQAKADTVLQALRDVGGPWVFIDNLNGGWVNSAGASAPASGAWQTGTGNVANPRGDGNADLYVGPDGTHPNVAGNVYLAARLATDLRAALQALGTG